MCQSVASSVMLRVHRVEVLFWWFCVLGYLKGTHWVYQKALHGHNNNSYARKAVDRPRSFMARTACTTSIQTAGHLLLNTHHSLCMYRYLSPGRGTLSLPRRVAALLPLELVHRMAVSHW